MNVPKDGKGIDVCLPYPGLMLRMLQKMLMLKMDLQDGNGDSQTMMSPHLKARWLPVNIKTLR